MLFKKQNKMANIIEYFKIGIKNLRSRKMRTWLTMLGIFIGIAAVISLTSLGQGLQEAFNEQFEQMGTDKIIISPGGSFFGIGGGAELTKDDMEVVKKNKDVEGVTEFIYKIAKVEFKDEVKYTWVMGLPLGENKKIVEDTQGFEIEKGRDLEKGDKYKAVITYLINKGDFFEKEVGLRDKIIIENQEFRVVGSLERIGNPQDDSSVLVPLETARELFDEPDKVDMILVQVQKGTEPDKVAEEIKEDLRDFRGVEEGEEDFSIQTYQDLIDTFNSILNVVQLVVYGIAAISLIVGGIGIMNTMYTSVLERTNEIGVMKAIGAKNSDVMWIFLIESGLLGLAGGIIGIFIGMGFSKMVELIAVQSGTTLLKAYFSWLWVMIAMVFSFSVGIISGLLPARQASKMKPVDALRYE
jgi:putative ABC transport system permease protein